MSRTVETLYVDHHGWLETWLRRKLGCEHSAADVAQDTFLRILTSRDALPAMREPRAYLTTTASRLLIDRSRRQRLEQAYLAELARDNDGQANHPSPEAVWTALELLEQMAHALEGLAANAQQAFLLHYLGGLTHAEVAGRLGVSTKMVQKYLVRALSHCHRAREA